MEVKNPERVERALRAYNNKLSYQKRYNRDNYEKLTVVIRKKDIEDLLKGLGVYDESLPLPMLKKEFPDVYKFFVKYLSALKLKEEMRAYSEVFLKQEGKWKEIYKRLAEEWVG